MYCKIVPMSKKNIQKKMKRALRLEEDDEMEKNTCDHFQNIHDTKLELSKVLKNVLLFDLQTIVRIYLHPIILLKSTKDEEPSVEAFVPYLNFHSSTMEMLYQTNEHVYFLQFETDIIRLFVSYIHGHGLHRPSEIERPLRSKYLKDVTKCAFDVWFIEHADSKPNQLHNLLALANYLNCTSLVYLGCAKVASKIKGVPLDDIKTAVNVLSTNISNNPPKCDCGKHFTLFPRLNQ
jgi:hypothetical protein